MESKNIFIFAQYYWAGPVLVLIAYRTGAMNKHELSIAGVTYTFELVDGWVYDSLGRKCHGLTHSSETRVQISRAPHATRRWKTCLHELIHIIKAELDSQDSDHLDEESLCNLVSSGLVSISPGDYQRLYEYITQEA